MHVKEKLSERYDRNAMETVFTTTVNIEGSDISVSTTVKDKYEVGVSSTERTMMYFKHKDMITAMIRNRIFNERDF